jgi:Nif-specific regulatory protein
MIESVPPQVVRVQVDDSPAYWRAQEMLLIQQVMSHVSKELLLETPLQEILHLMSELLGLNRGRVVLYDREESIYRIRQAYGLTKEEIERGRYTLGEGITGRVLTHKQLIIVQDIDSEPAFLARSVERQNLPQEPVSFIAMPIDVGQDEIGVLACHRLRRRKRPLSDDVTILRILSTLIGQLLQLRSALKQRTRALEQHNVMLAHALETGTPRYGIIGTSPALLRAIAQLEQVASASASVLLLGGSGTGKELFARALHLASPRRERPFIKVNCAAIPETLFESELFGHERGAFTGASEARSGWFEQANRGTIFLDEVGEMPLGMQAKLLRTLQEGTISRLGAKRETTIDVRVVAATNRNLQREVAEGCFREDLFYRLNVIPIRLPSLEERRGDIPLLVTQFVSRVNQDNQRNVYFAPDAMDLLKAHPWPGNIRELSNVVERIVLLAEKSLVTARDIEPFLAFDVPRSQPSDHSHQTSRFERPHPAVRPYRSSMSHSAEELQEAVRVCGGNKSRAAQSVGLTARQFAYRWRKCGLD